MKIQGKDYRTVWYQDNIIFMIDQPKLPHSFEVVELHNEMDVYDSIKNMTVRGAPAIGATGAFGLAQAANKIDEADFDRFKEKVQDIKRLLNSARPTARDLLDGLEYVEKAINESSNVKDAKEDAEIASQKYADLGADACKKMGEYGNELIKDGDKILTHCNAGALATVDYGTALAPIRTAHAAGKKIFVFADETRPRCQGARLTAFELAEEKIPHAVIADNAAGFYMKKGEVNLVIVGTDRVAANGDVANKIGTYEKAVLAKENNIPFYVAAPTSTIDMNTPTGDDIHIEERNEGEVLGMFGKGEDGTITRIRLAPDASHAKNPAFDVTPAKYVTGFITEKGIVKPDELTKIK